MTIAAWSVVVDFDKTPLFHLGVIDITSLILVRMDQLGRRQRSRSRFLRLASFLPGTESILHQNPANANSLSHKHRRGAASLWLEASRLCISNIQYRSGRLRAEPGVEDIFQRWLSDHLQLIPHPVSRLIDLDDAAEIDGGADDD